MDNRDEKLLEYIEIFKGNNVYERLVAIDSAYNLFMEVIKEIMEKVEADKEGKTKEESSKEIDAELERILPSLVVLNDIFLQILEDKTNDQIFRMFIIDCIGWFGNQKTYDFLWNLYTNQMLNDDMRLRVELALITINPNISTKIFLMSGEQYSYFLEEHLKIKSWKYDFCEIMIKYGRKFGQEKNDQQIDLKFFQKSVSTSPKNAKAWYHVGVIYIILKKYKLALHSLQKSVELEPTRGQIWWKLGQAQHGLNQIPQSVSFFEKAVQYEPETINHHISLGMAYYQINNLSGAKRCFDRALELDPYNEQANEARRLFREETGL